MDAETTRLLVIVGGFLVAFMIFRKLVKLAIFIAIGLALFSFLK